MGKKTDQRGEQIICENIVEVVACTWPGQGNEGMTETEAFEGKGKVPTQASPTVL